MNNLNSLAYKAGLRFTSMLLFAVAVGAGSAGAETFQRGGSMATIEQSGGNGTSKTQVVPYEDGQKIITQDGSSTDITIQRSASSPQHDYGREQPQSGENRFDRRSIEGGFSGQAPDERSAATCSGCVTSSASEEFKRRMLDRMDNRFLP